MELGTFGAIFRFALDMEEQAAEYYETPLQGQSAEVFKELAKGTQKRLKRLERARREGVAEMILESITGLDGDNYQIELDTADRVQQAITLENASARFYRDAAAKMPIKEIVRLFGRLAKENEQRKAKLENITPS